MVLRSGDSMKVRKLMGNSKEVGIEHEKNEKGLDRRIYEL